MMAAWDQDTQCKTIEACVASQNGSAVIGLVVWLLFLTVVALVSISTAKKVFS
jgi:hypothetical protein